MSLFARLVSSLVLVRSTRRMLPVAAVAGLGLLGACGSTPGGGGGILYSGGAAGTVCDPTSQNQGCLVEGSGFAVMQCTGTTWAKVASCTTGQVCAEEVVTGKLIATCKTIPNAADTTSGGDGQGNKDSSAATDAAAGGDSTLVDVNIVGQDGTTVSDAGKDTTTGKDTTSGKDTATGQDTVVKADISANDDVCGNTLCGPQEDEETCYIDCAPEVACVWDNCPTEKSACMNNADCKGFLACATVCQDEACQEECSSTYPNAESYMSDLDACGKSAGCFTGSTGNGSCSGVCGATEDQGGCYCDDGCVEYGDCCGDYDSECGGGGTPTGSCQGACGSDKDMGNCYCDSQCVEYGDCCADYDQFCPAP